MIKPILNRYLLSEEFYTLVKNIKGAISASNIDEDLKTKLIERLDKEFQNLESAINRLKKNPLTSEKEELDNTLNSRFLGFRSIVEGNTRHWDEEKAESATQLIEIIRRHGWSLHHEGYTAQSAGINSLKNELQKKPGSEYIEKTETGQWLEKLIDAQVAFEKITLECEEIDAQEKPLITTSKKSLYKDLTVTLSYIENQAEFYPSEELTLLIDNINQIITNITTIAKARNTRKHPNSNSN